ncbi:DUF1015 domain-containing protein [Mesoterricola silvestris]|uniref:DUF1015 domain-containing protein n=1 Tax=Mesoterricola silvestris TaxID=2927979 RepID=A0AA48H589_9BACT|nr:DUF1015 family protein [Mesoterricola silvestris]BDU72108.1 hypothetical protein METEAL_12820 [Mesoterricola silvestris]
MSQLKPFKAYRPKPQLAGQVAAVPYDVVNTDEARALAAGNPHSFLHVGRPEIDLPASTDIHADEVYAQGVKALKRLIAEGTLLHEDQPCLYVYQQRMGDHVQAGLVGLCSVKEYEDGQIKRHEYTRKDKEDDRTRHVTEQGANAEPVFLAYRAVPYIDSLVDKIRATEPLYDVTTPDGIGHTVWRIDHETHIYTLNHLFDAIPALYIADGHHRTAAAIRYGQARRAAAQDPTGDESFESFMAVVFPHDQLKIMDYNRVVKDLNGLTPEAFLAKVGEKFTVAPAGDRSPKAPTSFGMFLEGTWYTLTAKPGSFPAGDPVRSLDVSILQENLLAPVLGIQDPRTDTRIDFVGGIRGMDELERRVANGYKVAFSMFPTSLEQLMDVADAGQIMPPKSTWFEPKLRSGLLVRLYED